MSRLWEAMSDGGAEDGCGASSNQGIDSVRPITSCDRSRNLGSHPVVALSTQRQIMGHLFRSALMGILLLAAGVRAHADYPDHLIKILVPIPPGGAPDLVARLVAQGLSETFGQSCAVENRPGANGNLAGEAVAKAVPDGYTLLSGADSGIVINPHVYRKLGFDPLR